MKENIDKRLHELKLEYENGMKQLEQHEERGAELKKTLLRISGAVQVLEELLVEPESPAASPFNVEEQVSVTAMEN